jgi:hypothetical protein
LYHVHETRRCQFECPQRALRYAGSQPSWRISAVVACVDTNVYVYAHASIRETEVHTPASRRVGRAMLEGVEHISPDFKIIDVLYGFILIKFVDTTISISKTSI